MIDLHSEFKKFVEFVSRGNVIDLAVATVIGGAFTNIVNSFVNDLLGPVLEVLSSRWYENSFYLLKSGPYGPKYRSLEEAKRDGAVVISWGKFLQMSITFLIQAFCVFLLIRALHHIKRVGGVTGFFTSRRHG